jgi:glycosyltransferase involved in cell wall biosynthesis
MRVAQVINGEHYAGAERVQDLLAAELCRRGCETTFIALKPRLFDDVRRSADTPLVRMPMAGRWDLRVVPKLASLLRYGNFHLVHAHEPRSLLVGALAARSCGLPFVYHAHSPSLEECEVQWRNAINYGVERILLPHAQAVICVSEGLSHRFAWLNRTRTAVHVVHNGVEQHPHEFKASPPMDEWCIGIVALFRPRKGLETLLQALAELRARGKQVRLKAVGGFVSPNYRKNIECLV